MVNINISLNKEAYGFLKRLKGKDKSFSDVVLGFKKSRSNKDKILKFAGILEDKKDWKEFEKNMREFRGEFDERSKGTEKYMARGRK